MLFRISSLTGCLAIKAKLLEVEGFLSLVDAAQKLATSPDELSLEIAEGRVVAVVRDGQPWLSPGEVRRLVKSRSSTGSEDLSSPDESTEASPTEKEVVEATPSLELPPVEMSAVEQDLRKRCHLLSQRNVELEQINRRLKMGIQETEAALRRSRNAKANLENEVISFTEQLKKSQSRVNALEREVQHLTHELERAEEQHMSDMRRFRSIERGGSDDRSEAGNRSEISASDLLVIRQQMEEKDRIISQEYQERSVLRAQLEDRNQKFFELKARYEKEKTEWSEILARELQSHGQLKSQLEELNLRSAANNKGWNPFRREK